MRCEALFYSKDKLFDAKILSEGNLLKLENEIAQKSLSESFVLRTREIYGIGKEDSEKNLHIEELVLLIAHAVAGKHSATSICDDHG